MFSDNFTRCFENFFQQGSEPFFRSSGNGNIFNGFSLRPRVIERQSFPDILPRGTNWSVAHALGRVRQGNEANVRMNHDRLQWYDSHSNRPLAPLPNQPPRSMYLSRDELAQIKSELYQKESNKNNTEYDDVCDICLDKFKIGARLKILPCKHRYHSNCIDQWLSQRPVCPLCRAGVRGGLKKQKKQEQKQQQMDQMRKDRTNRLSNEEIDRRRKLMNEIYLKRRKKRLENQNDDGLLMKEVEKSKKNINNGELIRKSSCIELNEMKNEEKTKQILTENIINKNLTENKNNDIDEALKHDGMNDARLNAVAAALKRLEIKKDENNEEV